VLAAAASAVLAAEPGEEFSILHGVPTFHLDLLLIVLGIFAVAVFLAHRWYGKGLPERDPTLQMGAFSRVLVAKYGIDDFGYRYVVVPVRDTFARWASWSSNVVLDGIVASVGRGTKNAAMTTYRVLDQRVIDGGVNGAAFSAAWWSNRLKRIQSGDVQRYAGAWWPGRSC
jgi:NADH-quinone oxidoreductase subunit L